MNEETIENKAKADEMERAKELIEEINGLSPDSECLAETLIEKAEKAMRDEFKDPDVKEYLFGAIEDAKIKYNIC